MYILGYCYPGDDCINFIELLGSDCDSDDGEGVNDDDDDNNDDRLSIQQQQHSNNNKKNPKEEDDKEQVVRSNKLAAIEYYHEFLKQQNKKRKRRRYYSVVLLKQQQEETTIINQSSSSVILLSCSHHPTDVAATLEACKKKCSSSSTRYYYTDYPKNQNDNDDAKQNNNANRKRQGGQKQQQKQQQQQHIRPDIINDIEISNKNKKQRNLLSSSSSSSNQKYYYYYSFVDRNKISKLATKGHAIVVPTSKSQLYQNFMKISINCLFCRQTVEYFATNPYRLKSLCYFDIKTYPNVNGYIALTIDDVPSRFTTVGGGNDINEILPRIQQLLQKYGNSKATFFCIGKHIPTTTTTGSSNNNSIIEDQLVNLLKDGHELGNHGGYDIPHDTIPDNEFLNLIDDCSLKITKLQRRAAAELKLLVESSTTEESTTLSSSASQQIQQQQIEIGVKYFRSPHGKYTKKMEKLIKSRKLKNVMCDAYAADPIIEDSNFIANSLLKQARSGGIILLHMPEQLSLSIESESEEGGVGEVGVGGGFRNYCYNALEKLLYGLQQRNLKVVTVGMLESIAKGNNKVTHSS